MAGENSEIIDDLSGGLSSTFDPNRILSKESPTLLNVWYDLGALVKRPGISAVSSNPNTVFGRSIFGIMMHNSVFSGTEYILFLTDGQAGRNYITYYDGTQFLKQNTGGSGTAATTSGSPTVTGTSTDWTTTARAGAYFAHNATNQLVQISSVDSDTQLTLSSNYSSTNAAGAYTITNSWTSGNRVNFVDMNLATWIFGAGSTGISWNGTKQTFYNAIPQAKYGLAYKNYIFAGNYGSTPSRVSWSSLKDPTTWPATNFIDVNPDDGTPIQGMFLDGQSIVVLKTNSAYKITGDVFDPNNPTYTLTPISVPNDFVFVGHRNPQVFNGVFNIIGAKGFYSYGGGSVIEKTILYDKIRGDIANIFVAASINAYNVASEPVSVIVDGNLWTAVIDSTSAISPDKNIVLVIDRSNSIWKFSQTANSTVPISDFVYYKGTVYSSCSWTLGATTGLFKPNDTTVNNDAGVAINGTWTSKVYQFPEQNQFLYAYVYFKKQSAGNLTFSYSIDEGSFTAVTVSMTTGTGTRVKSQPIDIATTGYSIQFRLANSTAAQTFNVYGIQLVRRPLRQ